MSVPLQPAIVDAGVAEDVGDLLLTRLLRAMAAIGAVAVIATLLLARSQIESWSVFIFFVFATLLTTVIAFVPRVPYWVRTFTFLTIILGAGGIELLRSGLVGDGPLWLLGFALFAILFGGARLGAAAAATAVVVIALVGAGLDSGALQIDPRAVDGYVDGTDWMWMLFVLLVLLVGVVVGVDRLLQHIEAVTAGQDMLASQLELERLQLEEQVANRTRALETSGRLAGRLARILDQDTLVATVVEELQQTYAYYHVHVYLLPAGGTALRMVGGTGEPGRRMLAAGHQVPLRRGLVGRAASSGKTVLVGDVAADEAWLSNPLLPETRAEVAVPILIGRRVAGVIDVQQNRVDGLGLDDVVLLETIAAQLGVALQNAGLFADARRRAEISVQQSAVGQAIRRTRTVEDALRVTGQLLGDLLDADETTVFLSGPRPDAAPGSAP